MYQRSMTIVAALSLACVSAAQPQPEPATSPAPSFDKPLKSGPELTTAIRRADDLKFELSQTTAKYKPTGKTELDEQAVAFLNRAASVLAKSTTDTTWKDLAVPGLRLQQAGCEDAIILACLGRALVEDGDFQREKPLRSAVDGLKASDHHPLYLCLAAASLGTCLAKLERDTEAAGPFRLSADTLFKAISDPSLTSLNKQHILVLLTPILTDTYPIEVSTSVVTRMPKAEGADPWIADVLCGVFHLDQAWGSRGGGSIDTVSPRAAQGFKEGLAKAREHFERAHKLAPDRPQAAGHMINVAMAGGAAEDEGLKHWFDLATEAQFDYLPAYNTVLRALRPRWGGSLESVYAFGAHCASTERYDTEVPRLYITAILMVCEDLADYTKVWEDPDMYAAVKQTLTGLIADPAHAATVRNDKSLLCAIAWRSGQYDDAKTLLNELGANGFDAEQAWRVKAGPDQIADDCAAFTSDVKKLLVDSNAEAKQEHWKECRELRDLALHSTGTDAGVRQAISSLLASARLKESFESGAWTSPEFSNDGDAWRSHGGLWTAIGPASIRGTPNAFGLLLFTRAPLGHRFELEATISFDVDQPRAAANAGLLFGFETFQETKARWSSSLVRLQTQLLSSGVGMTGEGQTTAAAPVNPADNKLHYTVWDNYLVVTLGDKTVFDGPLPPHRDRWRPGDTVGLGGYYTAPGKPVTFSSVRLRKLTTPPPGAPVSDRPLRR